MKIAIIHGQWAQNIGNAFFNLGGEYVFQQINPENEIFRIMDQPNYRTLHNKFKGNPQNFWDPISSLDIDLVILQGPVLNAWLGTSWERTITALEKRGIKYAFHSSSFFKFSQREYEVVKSFIQKHRPAFISTRDSRAYTVLRSWDLDVPLIDGIDAGFFVNKVYKCPGLLDSRKLISFNFDRYPEPTLVLEPTGTVSITGRKYKIQYPTNLQRYAERSKVMAYLSEMFDHRTLPTELEGLQIIRPEHRFFPHITKKIYKRQAAYASDEPYTYLTNYASSVLTLSDRVHACVATLSYGGQAMLFTPSPRAALFERVGASNIKKEPVIIDSGDLANHQDNHIEVMKKTIAGLN